MTYRSQEVPLSHTPGPWKARLEDRLMRDGIEIFDADEQRVFYVAPDDTMEIEDGFIVECCSAQLKANVRLVSAAPDLLAACEALLKYHQWATRSSLADEEPAEPTRIAVEAITKARGQS